MNQQKYTLKIEGQADGKARPRVTSKGTIYSPADTHGFSDKIKASARAAHIEEIEGPVSVALFIHRAMPKSASKKRKALINNTWCISKPDIDNVFKSAMDALTGIAWKDDTQVVRITGGRWWAEEHYTVIEITPLQED
jgi:Holliday junction resolvase RusA-like endonuclease|tara:strand:+ start:121 stop:534 length:414 start_codon:yes stop_codon:yes gene_type:complete